MDIKHLIPWKSSKLFITEAIYYRNGIVVDSREKYGRLVNLGENDEKRVTANK